MRLDGPRLARAWLAVAQASAGKDDVAALNRTVAIEEFPNGLRLVATDRLILLTAWVPHLDALSEREPGLDEAPDRTIVSYDPDKRGRSLLGYVLTLSKRDKVDDLPDGALEVEVTFDARLPAGEAEPATFEGMDTPYTILAVRDKEKVWLPVVQATYPQWRDLLLYHKPQDTIIIKFNPELVQRVAGARTWAHGPMLVTFGGTEAPAVVDFEESDPHVTGLLMPMRWLLPSERETETSDPWDDPDAPREDPADDEATPDDNDG